MKRNALLGIALAAGMFLPCLSRATESTADQKAAATELLQTMHMDTMFSAAIDQMLDLQIKQNPQIEKFKPIMVDFFKKYMSWDAMKDDMAQLYAEEFTTDELKDMNKFFKTPTGQKLASKQTVLMSKGAELGQRKVQEHITELQNSIQEAMKDQKESKPPATGKE